MIDKLVPQQFKADQDERLTPANAFIDALNINVDTDEDGNAGIIKNCKGTTAVLDATGISYAGTEFEILGSVRDPERGRTYFFVWCSVEANKAIMFYDDALNSVNLVISGAFLNFSQDKKISASVVNGEFRRDGELNSLLYFTDDYNEPRKINVDRASEVLDASGNDRKELYLAVMKPAPMRPITASFARNDDFGVTEFNAKSAFQFAMQYIYKDGEISALGPYSKSYVAERIGGSQWPNCMILTMSHMSFGVGSDSNLGLNPEIDRIRILYREEKGVETSPFRILDEFDPQEGVTRTIGNAQDFEVAPEGGTSYTFINNGYTSTLPSYQEDLPYQAVPRRAKAQSIVNSRVFYGNYVEGFHNLGGPDGVLGYSGESPDVDITVNYQDASTASIVKTPLISDATSTTSGQYISGIDVTEFPETFYNGDVITLTIKGGMTVEINGTSSDPSLEDIYVIYDYMDDPYGQGDYVDLDSTFDVITSVSVPVCTVNAPIQYSIPIDGTYSREDVVDVMNLYLEDNPIVRTKTISITEDMTNWDSNLGSFPDGDLKITYGVRMVFANDGAGQFKFALRPLNPYQIGYTGSLGSGFTNQSVNGNFKVTGSGINSTSVTNAPSDQADREMYTAASSSISGFTGGSNHSFAFAYIDNKGRYGNAQEIGSVYVSPPGSDDRKLNGSFLNGPASISFAPKHEPPAWASGYSLLYAGPDDVDDVFDLNIDYPTKVVHETKFFQGKPDTVFVKISGYVDGLRKDGIEFSSKYGWEPGDKLRIISRRGVQPNGSYTSGTGTTGAGMTNPHTITDAEVFYSDFSDYEGVPYEFEIVSIQEMSKTLSVDDYPFILTPEGGVDPGIFLELKVPKNLVDWGANYILSIGDIVGDFNNPWVEGDNFNLFVNSGLITSYQGSQVDNINRYPYREIFDDAALTDSIDGQSTIKYLHNHRCKWDKGVRAQIIKAKQRTSAKVYHEIAEVRNFVDKSGAQGAHGGAFVTTNGFARFRKAFEFNPVAFTSEGITSTVVPGANGDPGNGDTRLFGGNPFVVRPSKDIENLYVESFEAQYGTYIKANHIGRLNVVADDAAESRKLSSVIHSGFQGSETLNLALQDFSSGNFKDMDVNNGAINAMIPSGEYMTVFQNSKVSRIPISRSIIATAGGDSNLTASNTVLGPEQSFNGDYGVDTDISAVIDIDKTVYFIDKGRRSIIKISNQGFNPISELDISSLIDKVFASSNADFGGYAIGYDKDLRHVLFTFRPGSSFAGDTLAYDHRKSIWANRYGFTPKAYLQSENNVLSVSYTTDSIVHSHDNDTNRATFYGDPQSASLSVISTMKNPSQVKVYNAIGIESNAPVDVQISNTDQSASLASSRFNKKERSYYASIPFDGSNFPTVYKFFDESALDPSFDLSTADEQTLKQKCQITPIGTISNASNQSGNFTFDVNFFDSNLSLGASNEDIVVLFLNGRWVPTYGLYLQAISSDDAQFLLTFSGLLSADASSGKVVTGFSVGAYITQLFDKADLSWGGYYGDTGYFSGAPIGLAKASSPFLGDNDQYWNDEPPVITVGGKKIRDHYAKIDISTAADGKKFELFAINVDADESRVHM